MAESSKSSQLPDGADEKKENLSQQLETLQKELEAIRRENTTIKQEYEALKHASEASTSTHDEAFWTDIQMKLRDKDMDGIKQLIKQNKITMDDTHEPTGFTLLHWAAIYGSYQIAALCLNLGADINRKDKSEQTALAHATDSGHYDIVQLLMTIFIGERMKEKANRLKTEQSVIENMNNELKSVGEQSKEIFDKVLLEIMIRLITKRLVFDDDMLGLCWMMEEQKGDPLKGELWKSIQETAADIIKGGNKRDWFWMKQCLIPSNIWLKSINGEYLYYKLLKLVNHESKHQIDILDKNISNDAAKDKEAWNELTTFEVDQSKLRDLTDATNNVRQDNIPNGITAEFDRKTLNHDATNESFDGATFYDHHQYLSKLSLLAEMVDEEFQRSVQKVFSVDKRTDVGRIRGEGDEVIEALYQRGPVKLMERARQKAENDYIDEAFPTTAAVLDLNRCSLIFGDIGSLLHGLKYLINKIASYDSGNVIGIVRSKNGFKEYVEERQYADIKLNVMIKGRNNNIIGEIQFLLVSMVKYKHRAHSLYAIQREEEFIAGAVSKLLPSMMDKEQQLKICAVTGDAKGLCDLMVFGNMTMEDIMQEFEVIITRGDVKAFTFVISMMSADGKDVVELLCDNQKGERTTPIEWALQKNRVRVLTAMTKIDGVAERFKAWDMMYRYEVFHKAIGGNDAIYGVIREGLKLNRKEILELLNYEHPDQESDFFQLKILHEVIRFSTFAVFKEVKDILGDKSFYDWVLQTDYYNQNVLDASIECKQVDVMKCILSNKAINEHCKNDIQMQYRVVCSLQKEYDERTAIVAMNALQLNEDKLKEIQSYQYPKPEDMDAFNSNHNERYAERYWDHKISNETLQKVLNASHQ
eukprot:431006_1